MCLLVFISPHPFGDHEPYCNHCNPQHLIRRNSVINQVKSSRLSGKNQASEYFTWYPIVLISPASPAFSTAKTRQKTRWIMNEAWSEKNQVSFRCKLGGHIMKTGKIQVKRRRKSGVRNAIVFFCSIIMFFNISTEFRKSHAWRPHQCNNLGGYTRDVFSCSIHRILQARSKIILGSSSHVGENTVS